MSLGRFGAVFSLELSRAIRRPMLWVLLILLAFMAWGLSSGEATIQSGDNTVGGARAWITSEFSMAAMLSIVLFLFYGFFLAIVAGMSVIRDQEERVTREGLSVPAPRTDPDPLQEMFSQPHRPGSCPSPPRWR